MKYVFVDSADPAYGYYTLAKRHRENRDYSAAEAVLREGTEQLPKSALLWNELAIRLRFDTANDDETLKCFAKAHKLAPDNGEYQIEYANFMAKRGYALNEPDMIDEAEYLLLCVYDDKNPDAHLNRYVLAGLGHLYSQAGEFDNSMACYGQCREIAPFDRLAQKKCIELQTYCKVSDYKPEDWADFLKYAQQVVNDRSTKDGARSEMTKDI